MEKLYTIGMVAFLAFYALVLMKAAKLGLFKNTFMAHIMVWYPRYWHRRKTFSKIYADKDLVKIAKQQFKSEAFRLYIKPVSVILGVCINFAIYSNFAPYFGWPDFREYSFIWKPWQFWIIVGFIGWCWGTSRANIWANQHLAKAPSKLILEWGELYRKNLLANPLHIRLVEKYWYMLLINKAMASLGGKEYGFLPLPNPDGSINLEASKLPRVSMGRDNRLEIDTQGFMLPYDVFVKSMLKRLESYTGLRTVSYSKSGKNSVINWQVTHKYLPDKPIAFSEAPKPKDWMTQYIGYIGISDDKKNEANWVPVRWKVAKHLALVGNTGMGKSVIMRTLMAGAAPETIILAGDLSDSDAVSFVRLKYDPYQLEALEAQKLPPEVYAYKKQGLDPLPTVIISRNKNEYFKMCQWLNRQFLDRTNICGDLHSAEDVFEIYEKTGFKIPRIMLFLDEAASAFIHASESDQQTKYIQRTIFDMLVKGRKMDIVVVMATQYASMEALGKARAQMHAITVYTKGSNTKLVYGEEIEIPAPGLDGEYIGTFVMETPDGGFVVAKALFDSQTSTAKRIFDRSNPPDESLTESLKYTLQLWREGIEAVEETDEFIPAKKGKTKIHYADKTEEVDA